MHSRVYPSGSFRRCPPYTTRSPEPQNSHWKRTNITHITVKMCFSHTVCDITFSFHIVSPHHQLLRLSRVVNKWCEISGVKWKAHHYSHTVYIGCAELLWGHSVSCKVLLRAVWSHLICNRTCWWSAGCIWCWYTEEECPVDWARWHCKTKAPGARHSSGFCTHPKRNNQLGSKYGEYSSNTFVLLIFK